jgi:predicted flap endonuclease-1-like 5' DNA nuclease
MFNNDVTKNYELQDATFEILIMLAGAFVLGALFCWTLGKLRGNKHNRKHPYQRKTVDQQNGFRQPAQQAGASYPDSRLKDTTSADLTDHSVTALNSKPSHLATTKSAVIERFSADKLPDDKSPHNKTTSDSSDNREATDANLSNTKSAIIQPLNLNEATTITDDFKKLEGIGTKIETALQAAGIKTYADLRASDNNTLKAILNTASPAFNRHDPETWPYQADLAYNAKWDKLKEYQDFLMGREASTD